MEKSKKAALLRKYPKELSGTQVCEILRISKRKCTWLLQNQVIPCEDTGKRTRRYKVRLEDVVNFLERGGGKDIPAIFSAAPGPHNPKPGLPEGKTLEDLHEFLLEEWKEVPDLMAVSDMVSLLGYSQASVFRWIKDRHLKVLHTQGDLFIPKEWVVDFCCGYGMTIIQMAPAHERVLWKFVRMAGKDEEE